MRTRPAILLLSALVVLAAYGCGAKPAAGPGPRSTSETGSGTLETSTATPPPSTVATPTAPAQPQTQPDLLIFIQAGSSVGVGSYGGDPVASFSTPSGNISCGVFGAPSAAVMCFIRENSWPAVPAQACNDFGDWTDDEVVASINGVRRGACFSEQPFPMPGNVLPYGTTISNGSVACRSESAFLACAHLPTGNGFVIAKTIFQTYGTVLPAKGN